MKKASSIRCIITAGPTREFFDPVRFMSNPSSGKMGYALAAAAVAAGWQVDLVSGPVALTAPEGVRLHSVVSGEDMLAAVQGLFSEADVLIKTAAVCDMRPRHMAVQKQKKGDLSMTIEMEAVPDILKTVAAGKRPEQVVMGFAAETNDVEAYARGKLEAKNLDYIVANQVGLSGGGFEADDNTVTVLGRTGSRQVIGPSSKASVAEDILKILLADKRLA